MTKKNRVKVLARERAASTGEKYNVARREILSQQADAPPPPAPVPPAEPGATSGPRALDVLLAALEVASPFPVEVGATQAWGRSADPEVARRQIEAMVASPTSFAHTGHIEMVISRAEMATLLAAGAGGDRVQFLRSFHNDSGTTFSRQCKRCSRWIFMGREERETACVCGEVYRVTFDLAPEDWSLRQGKCCVDCGTQFKLTPVDDGRNPWKPINAWQVSCALCRMSRPHIVMVETDQGGEPFIRYAGDVRPGTVEVFAIENGFRADWGRAYQSSSGAIEGHPLQLWRLPLRPFSDAELREVRGLQFVFRFLHPGGEKSVLGRLWSWDDRVVRLGSAEATAEPPESSTMSELRSHLVRIDDAE